MAAGKAKCVVCDKETSTFNCGGCLQNFCRIDLDQHLETLSKQLEEHEDKCNELRQIHHELKNDLKEYAPIRIIREWEEESIRKVRETAEQCREKVYRHIDDMMEMDERLSRLVVEMTQMREKNTFNEVDLNQCKQNLMYLAEELNQSPHVCIERENTAFINKITVRGLLRIGRDAKWKQNGNTIAGMNGYGNQLNQISNPHAFAIDDDQTIYIADYRNGRVLEWKLGETSGRVVAGGNGEGNQLNQLHSPSGIMIDRETNSLIIADWRNRRVMQWSLEHGTTHGKVILSDIASWGITTDKDGSLYVSDTKKHEVKRWRKGEFDGIIVAGGNGQGHSLNQLNHPTFMFVDSDYSLYVSDYYNHRVMKWTKDAKEGVVVAGGNGQGKQLRQLEHPHGLIVDRSGQIYVSDRGNHRVMRWCPEANEGTIVVGRNEKGRQANQLTGPTGLAFDLKGNLYVADSWNNRIQIFQIDN